MEALTNTPDAAPSLAADDALFGWDPTPCIVSVWGSRTGKALVWQRLGGRVSCTRESFRPWLFATTLDDLTHLGQTLQLDNEQAQVSYREFDGPADSYRYVLSARDGRFLERACSRGHRVD